MHLLLLIFPENTILK